MNTEKVTKMSEAVVEKKDKITAQAAQAIIDQEKQERALACGKAVNELLKKFNCELIAVPFFTTDGRVAAQSQIKPK
jgi:hypothetical protein